MNGGDIADQRLHAIRWHSGFEADPTMLVVLLCGSQIHDT